MPRIFHVIPRTLAAAALLTAGAAAADQELQEFKNCRLVATVWADGDSFEIETTAGNHHTIRLYGADCFEWHVTDETDARRLRAQRRYFGMTGFGGSPEKSIQAAKDLGEAAAKEVAKALAQPFTVHTAFADAMGDGRHPRIYAFVTTGDDGDLAGMLVRAGLARAYGVYRETPGGKSKSDYQAALQDLELQAAKRGAGGWAKTDWDSLPGERKLERDESAELELATSTKLPAGRKINPNTAARDELMQLPGIGETTANRIIEARPFKSLDDLRRVDGIGPKTLERMKPHLTLP
ncbi:MAG: helix-hairpin-helix domain-containing protein [Akkermansiaceae bacterium]|nr:helix-hairpin-helix domain-containing protein [Akkermansiaceae bacterium]